MCHDWPKAPIWPDDLPLIRELLTDEECAELLKRLAQVPVIDTVQRAFVSRSATY